MHKLVSTYYKIIKDPVWKQSVQLNWSVSQRTKRFYLVSECTIDLVITMKSSTILCSIKACNGCDCCGEEIIDSFDATLHN